MKHLASSADAHLVRGAPVPTRLCLAMQSNWDSESLGPTDAERPTSYPPFSPGEHMVVWVSMLLISVALFTGPLLCTQHLDFCILPYRGDEGLPASH